jgi:hypothetical protein
VYLSLLHFQDLAIEEEGGRIFMAGVDEQGRQTVGGSSCEARVAEMLAAWTRSRGAGSILYLSL